MTQPKSVALGPCYARDGGICAGNGKDAFLKDGRRFLKAVLAILITPLRVSGTVRVNKGGPAVSGEVYLDITVAPDRVLHLWLSHAPHASTRADHVALIGYWRNAKGQPLDWGPNLQITISDSAATARALTAIIRPTLAPDADAPALRHAA